MVSSLPHYIIAIGASAGGLEEINSFFDHTPSDQVSYIIIQHLSADFKSHMAELLKGHSKLEVVEVLEGTQVLSNKVYLIPHNKIMTIEKGILHLEEKIKSNLPNLTINIFFNSLAIDCGSNVIGIILSGMGSDGTQGIEDIHNAGGIVIARPPSGTKFGSMPAHAIATGLVDFILEPSQMPQAIEEFIKSELDFKSESKNDENDIDTIINFIKNTTSFDFSEYKRTTLLRRTKRRGIHLGYKDLKGYLAFLKINPKEVEELSQNFLISVTSFFRDSEAFDFLKETVIPEIFNSLKKEDEIKIWVPGCATGEEAYSFAIMVQEELENRNMEIIVKIFATDIDEIALNFGRHGLFSRNIKKSISPERLEKYFIKEGDEFRISPKLRNSVIFAKHDLVKNPPYCNMNLISCRNLLIYMTPVLQKKIFKMLQFGLKKNGILFIGSSENALISLKNLEVINKKWKIYRNLTVKNEGRLEEFSLPGYPEIKPHNQVSTYEREEIVKNNSPFADEINESLVKDLGILSLLIDENKNVVKSYGDTQKFLDQKNFSINLLEILPKSLDIAFISLLREIGEDSAPVFANGIRVEYPHSTKQINLRLSRFGKNKGRKDWFLLTLQVENSKIILAEKSVSKKKNHENESLNLYILSLKEEMKDMRERLQSSYDQLDSSNENLQSYNEELISANEEMQSTNEEIQSVNEELDTVNFSYQVKNKELIELNDDLNNYFRSNINGQLFINNKMEILRFSPISSQLINLLESDIGRPLAHISTNFKLDSLIEDVKKVMHDGIQINAEVETNSGKWFQLTTIPYIQTSDHKNVGAIITFSDITELKNAQFELDKKNKLLTRINGDLDNFVHAASHDLLAPLGNIEMSISVMNMIEVPDPELNKFLEIINSSAKKFRILIKDMASIAKLESESKTMEIIDINEIINNIEWSLALKIKDSKAVILRNLVVQEVIYSKKNLRSILYNLIANSIKFKGKDDPKITIQTRKVKDFIVFSVDDNGIGISREGLPKIFDIYGRLHQDTEGLGIGLYLAKKIVVASGGDIEVESKLGVGTKFTVFLKLIPELN